MRASACRRSATRSHSSNPGCSALRIVPICFTAVLITLSANIHSAPRNQAVQLAAQVRQLNSEFLAMQEQSHTDLEGARQALRSGSVQVLQRRQQALQRLIEEDPFLAISLTLRPSMLNQLASEQPALRALLETHGTWTGKLEYFVIDDASTGAHRVVRRLVVGDRKSNLYFMGAEPDGVKDGDLL